MKRGALALLLLPAFLPGCGEDKKKPLWDWKQAFGQPIVEISGYVPFIDDAGVEKLPGWRYEVIGFARSQIERLARNAKEEYERRYAKKDDTTSPSAVTYAAFGAIASACKVKIAMTTEDRAKRDAAGIASCKGELMKLDTALEGWGREASTLGLPPGAVARLTTEPPLPAGQSEIGGMKKLLEKGPAELAWQALRIDPNATHDALKKSCDDAEKEIASLPVGFPSSLHDLVEARAHFAKGRKLMLMHAGNMSNMEPDALPKMKETDRDQACKALRELSTSLELPVVYGAKIAALVSVCPARPTTPPPPSGAPAVSASPSGSASPSASASASARPSTSAKGKGQ